MCLSPSRIFTPIPGLGLSVELPWPVGTITAGGMFVGDIEGTVAALDVQIGVDACAEIAGSQLCGSSLTSLLPFNVIDDTFGLSGVCDARRAVADLE